MKPNFEPSKILYVGTTEEIAKLAPTKGLEAPIFLTDVYVGHFCKVNCPPNAERWGIVSIKFDKFFVDMLAPTPAYVERLSKRRSKNPAVIEKKRQEILDNLTDHKSKWKKSLERTGVCTYLVKIPPTAIEKVMIYTANGRNANSAINKLIEKLPDPFELSAYDHKSDYSNGLGVTRWLNGEAVKGEDFIQPSDDLKAFNEIDDKLTERYGLDVYYIRPEDKVRKKKV